VIDRSDVALIVRPIAWRQLRAQIAVFDRAIRVLVRSSSACPPMLSKISSRRFILRLSLQEISESAKLQHYCLLHAARRAPQSMAQPDHG
jgi:hypothetical protein